MSNILILDSDPSVCSVTQAAMRKTAHHLFFANSAYQAIEIARKQPIAMAIMDVETVNGAAFCRNFSSNSRRYRTPRRVL